MAKKKESGGKEPYESKMGAVRTLLGAGDIMPVEGVKQLKERFGIDMTPKVFSSYKAQLRGPSASGMQKLRGEQSVTDSLQSASAQKAAREKARLASFSREKDVWLTLQ